MLFGRQHEHRKTERSGDKHLDEHALSEVDIPGGNWAEWTFNQKRSYQPVRCGESTAMRKAGCATTETHILVLNRTRSESKHDASRGDGADHLRDAIQDEPRRADASDEKESEADVRVEEPPRRAEEEPGGDEQAEAESGRDVERALESRAHNFVRCLRPTERQEQKHRRPHEFEKGRL